MKVSLNRKGFTLVELLAVIVVLAVIILIAMPSVMNSMEKARRNSFVIEANTTIKAAQTAYAEYLLNRSATGSDVCIPYKVLKSKGFIEKNDGNYQGSVLINAKSNAASVYTIWLSNNAYKINGVTATELKNSDATPDTNKNASEECGSFGGKILSETDLN